MFAGTNFRETGSNPGFRNFRGFNFHGQDIEPVHMLASCTAKAEQMSRKRDGQLGS